MAMNCRLLITQQNAKHGRPADNPITNYEL